MNLHRVNLSSRLRLSLWRWASIALLAAIGAVVFEVALPVGWRYIKPLPEPTRWFSGWFVYLAASCALLALAFLAVEPIRFRSQHVLRLHQYPPLSFAIVFAVALAMLIDVQAPPLHHGIVPTWSWGDVLIPLALVAVLASAIRQRPWRWSPREKPPIQADKTIGWDALKQWFQREEPLQDGPDLLGHSPIAARIHNAILESRNQGIALIGPIGSGKSSILNAVKRELRNTKSPFVIVAEFNCWAMPRPEDAPRIALERAVEAIGTVIDAQAVRRLPMSYQRVLAAEPTGKISKLLGLDDVPDAAEQLKALSPLLEVLDARLLLIIEDAERAGRAFETRPLERLLWTLRQVERVSFVLSFDVEGAAFDYLKVCDVVERIPRVSVNKVEEILAPAYEQWRAMGQGYLDPLAEPRKDRLGLENVTNPMLRYLRRTHGDSAVDAISALLTSPRKLKHFIRDVDRAWTQLLGEVELNDLIVLTVLRHAVPEVWDFIVENVETARSERRDRDDFAGEKEKTVAARWERLRNGVSEPSHVQHLVDVLDLPQLASKTAASSQESPQGIHNDGPVDYLGRILAGQVLPGDIRDQEVLREIEEWKASRSEVMLNRLTATTETSDQYANIWEHYADRLSDDDLIDVTGGLIAALLKRDRANAAMEHPAMLAAWRRCNRRHGLRDTRTDWLTEQIQAVLPVSLGFASGLFQYFASVKHGIVSADHRAQIRAAEVATAKGTLVTVEALFQSLGAKHEYPITRFVYPPPTDEPEDTIPPDSWEWFFKLVIEAAKTHEERIVPDVAVLVGDTTAGFRSGAFEQRYVLKREWFSTLFGRLADAMLYIFVQYQGTNGHALNAKKEAERWLDERVRPPKRIDERDPLP